MDTVESELIDQIHRAFSGVKLEDGVSLNMTEYFDSGGLMPQYELDAKGDEREEWAAIPDETLEQFTVTFSFTDLKGYRFYIPAYMSWFIRNHRTSNSILVEKPIYAIDPTSYQFDKIPFLDWFTGDQIAVMKKFLEYAAADDDEWARENLAKIASAQQNAAGQPATRPEPK